MYTKDKKNSKIDLGGTVAIYKLMSNKFRYVKKNKKLGIISVPPTSEWAV